MQLGLGRLGLAPAHFWALTLQEFRMAAEGHYETYNQGQRQDWERARWLALRVIMPHTKKGSKLQAQDLGVFPWEKPDSGIKLTKEELRARLLIRDEWQG